MPIDASIISQARNIPQIRYQPESQFESFAKIQPTLNAMQQMRNYMSQESNVLELAISQAEEILVSIASSRFPHQEPHWSKLASGEF
jgi:hypothetical protein